VTELMIVVIILMKNFVTMIVRKINLNAVAMADVFWALGNAMATRIVLMAPTKIRIFVVSYLHFDFASILVLKKPVPTQKSAKLFTRSEGGK
jgi:hypothetical protein